MATYTAQKHPILVFSYQEEEELKTLRTYAEKLTALAAALAQEFPGAANELTGIKLEIGNTAKKIADLEILKIQAELKFDAK
jgi:hypothetical protein